MRTKTDVLVAVLFVVFVMGVAITISIRLAWGVIALVAGLAVIACVILWYYFATRHQLRAVHRKILGFDPRDQNVADGVIASFYQLRITPTELINGYLSDAPRISLQGLGATVEHTEQNGDRRVQVTVEGPRTKLAYAVAGRSAAVNRQAQAFATVLNVTSNKLPHVAPQETLEDPLSGSPHGMAMKTKGTFKARLSRPWIWFVVAAWWSLQTFQDVHAGKTYVWDLLAAIIAIGLGVYFVRQNRRPKR